ncbi:bacillithiol biosynthesis cysteine-adding enzyme BshC [Chryseolinea sp. T2]|uniref:bacillithiol biosynthesis cysteine-adding enzyme BshC n=1 Tax=Chryseolinea sp. T2 TaxID=3129255 RepID=UPI0030772094
MQLDKVSLADTNAFSKFFLDYMSSEEALRPYFHREPHIENFGDQITNKVESFTIDQRSTLVQTLKAQYEGFKKSPALEQSINLLSDQKTVTITTGHQLNIFTGPLYFIFKIVTVINTCKRLKQQYPEYNFVPVYWMASEDHDYDEIKYFRLHGKKYVWETNQTGAVGRFNTTGLDKLASEVSDGISIFREAYSKRKNLAAATRHFVNELFGEKGLVVIDADSRDLKRALVPAMRDDILLQDLKGYVDISTVGLNSSGYKTQVFCRDINFFYLHQNIRSRIEKDGDRFIVVDTDLSFSRQEIEKLIDQEPERFSPNVILRPLYQELILPNIAYVGGPSEVVYWMQLQDVFEFYRVPFPILMPRNFGMVIDHEVSRKWSKTGLTLKDLFEDKNYLFNEWVLAHSNHDLSVSKDRSAITNLFNELRTRAEKIDPTLKGFIEASAKRSLTSLDKAEHKMLRAEKRNQSDKLRQIGEVKDILFPGGGLQERTDNFLNFYLRDPSFIDSLLEHFDPFDYRFNILSYTA